MNLLADIADSIQQTGLDACTLNNALNVAQLIAIVWLIRLLQAGARDNR